MPISEIQVKLACQNRKDTLPTVSLEDEEGLMVLAEEEIHPNDSWAGGEKGSLKERDPRGGYVPTSFLLTHTNPSEEGRKEEKEKEVSTPPPDRKN